VLHPVNSVLCLIVNTPMTNLQLSYIYIDNELL